MQTALTSTIHILYNLIEIIMVSIRSYFCLSSLLIEVIIDKMFYSIKMVYVASVFYLKAKQQPNAIIEILLGL